MGVVSWKDISGGSLSEIPNITEKMDACIDIVDVVFGEGKYGRYAVVTDVAGNRYRTSSSVLMNQLEKVSEYMNQHPDVIAVRVKVGKVKNYYTFSDCDGEHPPGVVEWSSVGGRHYANLSEIPNITEKMGQVVTITGADEFDGRYGKYWVIKTKEGVFKTSSTVIGEQAMQIVDFLKSHPDVDGVAVKVMKVKNYYKLGDPSE